MHRDVRRSSSVSSSILKEVPLDLQDQEYAILDAKNAAIQFVDYLKPHKKGDLIYLEFVTLDYLNTEYEHLPHHQRKELANKAARKAFEQMNPGTMAKITKLIWPWQ